jgi:hypothetical protein
MAQHLDKLGIASVTPSIPRRPPSIPGRSPSIPGRSPSIPLRTPTIPSELPSTSTLHTRSSILGGQTMVSSRRASETLSTSPQLQSQEWSPNGIVKLLVIFCYIQLEYILIIRTNNTVGTKKTKGSVKKKFKPLHSYIHMEEDVQQKYG